jgi:hypothetical protein
MLTRLGSHSKALSSARGGSGPRASRSPRQQTSTRVPARLRCGRWSQRGARHGPHSFRSARSRELRPGEMRSFTEQMVRSGLHLVMRPAHSTQRDPKLTSTVLEPKAESARPPHHGQGRRPLRGQCAPRSRYPEAAEGLDECADELVAVTHYGRRRQSPHRE